MKKALLLALVLVFALSTFVGAAPATAFIDVPANDPSYKYVQQLVKAGVVDDTAGTFNGNKLVTRYEMAAFTAKAINSMDKASAANKVLIQKLAVEFEATLEEMNVRLTAMETKAAAVQGWFTPTMPKWSGEFDIAYTDGAKNYFSPYLNGTGNTTSNQGNNVEFDLNFNGNLATGYNIQYHGGWQFLYNYTQNVAAPGADNDHGLTFLTSSANWDNEALYIDGDFPGITGLTKALYGANTRFAVGRVAYTPGAGLAVDSTINGAKLSNIFDNGLQVDLFFGLDKQEMAYAATYTPNPQADPLDPTIPKGYYDYGAIIRPSNNTDINGENFFNMYGQVNDAANPQNPANNHWNGFTGYTASTAAIGASYPIGPWKISAGYSAYTATNTNGRTPVVGQQIDARTGGAVAPGSTYDVVRTVSVPSSFNSIDAGVSYDDGYWHGNAKFAYSPTYDCYNTAEISRYTNNIISINTGVSVEVHAGTTDNFKQWSYDAYLKYTNLGPLMGYAPSGDTLGMGGTAYKVGFDFVPLNGTKWENSFVNITSALNSAFGSDTAAVAYQSSNVVLTKIHFFF
ncbi:MAG: S-layer homology domain-containing protein [Negativicutes bacterium]|jgi:hypothetical protein